MPDWSIKIEGNPAVFTPDIDGTPAGEPLKVVQGDLVSWNNMTGEPHWPAPDDPVSYGQFMTGPVAPNTASTAYNVVAQAGTTIPYHCSLHPEMRGKIVVVKFGEN